MTLSDPYLNGFNSLMCLFVIKASWKLVKTSLLIRFRPKMKHKELINTLKHVMNATGLNWFFVFGHREEGIKEQLQKKTSFTEKKREIIFSCRYNDVEMYPHHPPSR